MRTLFIALGLVFVLEGAAYALFLRMMQRMGEAIQQTPAQALRVAGLVGMAIGWLIVYLAHG